MKGFCRALLLATALVLTHSAEAHAQGSVIAQLLKRAAGPLSRGAEVAVAERGWRFAGREAEWFLRPQDRSNPPPGLTRFSSLANHGAY